MAVEIQEKIALIAETLEVDGLELNTELGSLEEWDSMAKLSLIVMVDDEFGKKLTADDIKGFSTVQDIVEFIG